MPGESSRAHVTLCCAQHKVKCAQSSPKKLFSLALRERVDYALCVDWIGLGQFLHGSACGGRTRENYDTP